MNKPTSVYLFFILSLVLCLVLPLTLLLSDALAVPGRAAAKPLLVATNQGDRDLSIIDPVTVKQLATRARGRHHRPRGCHLPGWPNRIRAHLWELGCG